MGNDQGLKIRRIAVKIPACIIGLIFLIAAFSKMTDLSAFEKAVRTMPILPQMIKGLAVLFIPGVELALGFCLFTRVAVKEASFLATLLLLAFLVLSIQSTLAGSVSGCACFKIPTPTWLKLTGWWIVLRNVIFVSFSTMTFAWDQES